MQEDFKPPQDDAEFERRAKEITPKGARIIYNSLKGRRAQMVKSIDVEIEFYKKVIEFQGGSV